MIGIEVTPGEFYDRTAKKYDREYSTSNLFWKMYDDITWDNIKRYLPKVKKSRILDAGGGTGRWAVPLAKLGYTVVLTDISKGMLDIARRKIAKKKLQNRIQVLEMDVLDMRHFPDESFDMVIAEGDLLSYCGKPKKAVKEMNRVVKKNSPVIASVDNRISGLLHLIIGRKLNEIPRFLEKGDLPFRDEDEKVEFKAHFFLPEELKKLFESQGLKVVKLIGKPVIPWPRIEKLVHDKNTYKKILQLQIKLAEDVYRFGNAGHLEIIGIKRHSRL